MSVQRSLPSLNADSSVVQSPTRTGPYLESYGIPLGASNWAFADEGSYFVATNATVGTGIAGHAAPVVADTDTKPLFFLFNSSATKSIFMDYLFFEVTAAGTAGTIHYTVVYVDAAGATARTSGGTAITPTNANPSSSIATAAVVHFGAVVAAMTSSRSLGNQIVREVIPVVQDTNLIKFGGGNAGANYLTTAGTATCHTIQHFGPCVIGPGGNLNISQIRPSQSAAASYQFSAGWVER